MKNLKFLVFFALGFLTFIQSAKSQTIRTYNNIFFGTSIAKPIKSFNIGLGETVEINGVLPIRLSAAATLKLNTLSKSSVFSNKTISAKLNKNINQLYLGFPIGIEVFKGSIGLGIQQELFNLGFRNSFDSTNIKTGSNFNSRVGKSSFLFQKNNTLSNNIYLVATVSESFSIKLGLNTDHILLTFYDKNDKKAGTNRYTSTGFYISLRTNIEK